MNNLFVLSDARAFVAQWVDNGSCNAAAIDARINEACRRLRVKADWPYTVQTVRIRTDNQQFPLPRECEKIIWCNADNNPAYVYGPAYEFLSSGPGEVKHRYSTSGFKDVVDAGWACTMYDIPPIETFPDVPANAVDRTLGTGYYLAAFSTEHGDTEKTLSMYGSNELLNNIGSGASAFAPGEVLKVNRWSNGVEGTIDGPLSAIAMTSKTYREIHKWVKPATAGYITLYAVNPSNNYMWLLAKAHPDDTVPSWRRYKVTNQLCSVDSSTGKSYGSANILALCKMADIKLTRPDDVLPIQNLDAIKNMVIAIGLENAMNLEGAVSYEANATRILQEQKQDAEVSGGMPVVVDIDPRFAGASCNRFII